MFATFIIESTDSLNRFIETLKEEVKTEPILAEYITFIEKHRTAIQEKINEKK